MVSHVPRLRLPDPESLPTLPPCSSADAVPFVRLSLVAVCLVWFALCLLVLCLCNSFLALLRSVPSSHLPHSAFSASKCPLSSPSQILCLQHSRNMFLCCLENGLASVFDSNVLHHTNLASHCSFVSSFVTQFFGCTLIIEDMICQHRCFSGIMGSGRVVTHYFFSPNLAIEPLIGKLVFGN